jgi:hypothetical protein
MDRTFHEKVVQALAFMPQSVAGNGTAVDGVDIDVTPAARALVLAIQHGDPGNGNTSELSIAIEGSEDGGTTFAAIEDKDGDALVFDTITVTGSADESGAGVVLGTLPIERLPYNAYRVSITNTNAETACIVGASALLVDTLDRPTGQADGLLAKMLPDGTDI